MHILKEDRRRSAIGYFELMTIFVHIQCSNSRHGYNFYCCTRRNLAALVGVEKKLQLLLLKTEQCTVEQRVRTALRYDDEFGESWCYTPPFGRWGCSDTGFPPKRRGVRVHLLTSVQARDLVPDDR